MSIYLALLLSIAGIILLVKGGDWAPESVAGREVVEAEGGDVHCLPLLEGFSTTGLARRIAELGRRGLM